MKLILRKQDNVRIKSWINDKPISNSNWNIYMSDESDEEILIVAEEPNTGNKLKINILRYENFEEIKNEPGDRVPASE
jgi:hypothetical protein